MPEGGNISESSRVGELAARGTAWSIGSRLVVKVLDLAALALLARVLTPRDFGIVAIASTLIGLLEAVFELPLSSILMREKDLTKHHLDTAFTLSLSKGIVLSLIVAALAVPAARLYHEPSLFAIMSVLVAAPILRGLQSPALVFRTRALNFRSVSSIEIIGKLVGLSLGVAVALRFHSLWALVLNSVATPAAMLLASFLVAPYTPRLTVREWTTFSSFLKWSSVSQLIGALNWQSDRAIVGLFIPVNALGRYSLASTMASLPDQVAIKPLGAPFLAAFSAVKHNRQDLTELYLQGCRTLLFVYVPAVICMCALAEPLVRGVLGGGKWSAAAPLLKWLLIASLFYIPYTPMTALATAVGQLRVVTIRSAQEFIVQLPLTIVLSYFFGITGLLEAKFLTGALMLVLSFLLVKKVSGITFLDQLQAIRESVIAGIMMAATISAVEAISRSRGGELFELGRSVIACCLGMTVFVLAYFSAWRLGGRKPGFEDKVVAVVREARRHLSAG